MNRREQLELIQRMLHDHRKTAGRGLRSRCACNWVSQDTLGLGDIQHRMHQADKILVELDAAWFAPLLKAIRETTQTDGGVPAPGGNRHPAATGPASEAAEPATPPSLPVDIAEALEWARSQVGKPYDWGPNGPPVPREPPHFSGSFPAFDRSNP